jgi:hypothetical protein
MLLSLIDFESKNEKERKIENAMQVKKENLK